MLTVAYNLSITLKTRLSKVDTLRQKILLIPTSPQTETALRWQTTLFHLEGWASLSNQPMNKTYILDTINNPMAYKIVNYKNAINFVCEQWPANPTQVSFKTIDELARLLGVNHGSEKEICSLLNYLQTGQMHPLIQSATAHLYFYPSRLSYLTSLLFLTKYGYGMRGWLSLEDYWSANKQEYLLSIQQATSSANTTLWLEYFCQAVIYQMEKIIDFLNHPPQTSHNLPKSYWQLTDRLQEILSLMEKPDISISNKKIQSTFNVSQITASRDLAKLTSLGLLIPHGHGRSTYYTRA